ncbi:unnamed protein product [Paramecium octaurelia]|uniref:Uncharacterized protein n=1 Tax=Paramecium octaurelia TaxID=43137 RepID=A0A8S1YJW8_PAROT|nr:unnamed protein product [Paramecium octaurelia]
MLYLSLLTRTKKIPDSEFRRPSIPNFFFVASSLCKIYLQMHFIVLAYQENCGSSTVLLDSFCLLRCTCLIFQLRPPIQPLWCAFPIFQPISLSSR